MPDLRIVAKVVAVVVVIAILIGLTLWKSDVFKENRQWRIQSGVEVGTYNALGENLSALLNEELAPFESFTLKRSSGSEANVQAIESDDCDIAFVQSDCEVASHSKLRNIAPLYQEVLHILCRPDVETGLGIDGLRGRRLFVGPEGSGTHLAALKILGHFGLDVAKSEATSRDDSAVALVHGVPSASELSRSLAVGDIDSALILAGVGSKIVRDLLTENSAVEFLSIGDSDAGESAAVGFSRLQVAYHAVTIPKRLYGDKPQKPVHSVAVDAYLVASSKVDDEVVHEIARTIHERRSELAKGKEGDFPLMLDSSKVPSAALMPVHHGAATFYHRDKPSFFVENAEAISLVITLMVGFWSLSTLILRWLADLKKERIDRYFAMIMEASAVDSDERITKLRSIHRQAFEDLMAEKLKADSSFVIFHDYLLSEIDRATAEQGSS